MAVTPDLPPPDMACMDVIMTFLAPYLSRSGFSVITKPVVVQLGSGATQPFQERLRFCSSSSSAWSSLMPGMRMGTSSSYLYAELVDITGRSLAKRVSISRAGPDSTAENIRSRFAVSTSSTPRTVISRTYSGMSPPTSQATIPVLGSRMASTYFLPAVLDEAAIWVTSNQGWFSSDWMNS